MANIEKKLKLFSELLEVMNEQERNDAQETYEKYGIDVDPMHNWKCRLTADKNGIEFYDSLESYHINYDYEMEQLCSDYDLEFSGESETTIKLNAIVKTVFGADAYFEWQDGVVMVAYPV